MQSSPECPNCEKPKTDCTCSKPSRKPVLCMNCGNPINSDACQCTNPLVGYSHFQLRHGDFITPSGTIDPGFFKPTPDFDPKGTVPHDSINYPRHYTSHPSGIECIQITEHMNFCIGNAVKYLWRADLKNGLEDLKKAQWYITREIDRRSRAKS